MIRVYKQKDKVTIYLTRTLAEFLKDEHETTNDDKSSIVRRALNEYMMKRIAEKIEKREKIKQYMVDAYK